MGITTDFAAQKQIDRQIAKETATYRERVGALKSQRNTYCAINKIPDEVLLRVFLFVKLGVEKWCQYISDARREWFTLMRVCQSWRNLVLECPYFWTYIDASSPDADRMLARSKGAPLEVVLHEPLKSLPSNEQFWTFAAEIMARVTQLEELTLKLQDITDVSRLYFLSSSKHAPILETLTLSERSPDVIEGQDLSDVVWLHMPSLSSLYIYGVPSLPMAFVVPRLTIFHLSSSRPISLSWILAILQNSPLIESLDIEGLGPEPSHFTTSPVSLPNMRKFFLHSKWFGGANIFKYLRLPVTAAFEAMFKDTDVPEEAPDLSGVVSTFSRFASNYSPSRLERIAIEFLPSFTIYVYRPEDEYWLSDCDGGLPLFLFSSPRETPIPVPITSYSPLWNALPLSSLHILALTGVKGDTLITTALSLLNTTIHIKTLELEDFDVELLDHLFKLHGAELPMNPELECLIFKRVLYDAKEERELLPVVVRLLRERRRLGIPIRVVKGWYPESIPARTMRNLKRLVDVVDCQFQ
ncbi:hypothetical protein ONZ45_g9796 [Pleurotus djamor]|nr:hypothetical protein ONZ45_g9796 [Pleurotus djamor]